MPDNPAPNPQPAGPSPTHPGGGRVGRVAGVHLDMAPGKDVAVHVDGLDQGYRGRIVGYEPYEYIIARVRLPSSVRRGLPGGGRVVIKYVHKGTVFGFRAGVLATLNSPAPLVVVEYPDAIERIELRRKARHRCQIDGLLHTPDNDRDCLVLNVSEAGCRVSARSDARDPLRRARVDDVLAVSMHLGASGTVRLPISVRSLGFEEGIVTIGSMFLDIRKEEVELVQKHLEKISRLTPRAQT